jgi:hypothetical protein
LKGCPSEEGPLESKIDFNYNFLTYSNMVYYSHSPYFDIVPYQTWNIEFTNDIELYSFDPLKDIEISPSVKYKATASGKYISIFPQSKGQTTYTVKVKTSIKDVFGQNLIKQENVAFNVGKASPLFKSLGNGDCFILDSTTFKMEEPSWSIMVVNVKKIKVKIVKVNPKVDFYLFKADKIR